MEKIFKEEHQVSYGDCEETGKIQLPHLIEHFMQVSNDQLTSGGAGIHDLLKQNLGWVVDTNHHLTNSIYFDWMIDTLPREFLNSHTVKSIDISFKKEVQYGNQALAEVELDQDTLTSYHLISNQGEESALAEINWKEN